MQYRPTAPELLDAIAVLLQEEVLPAVPPSLQHKVRVAANLTRIVERELLLGPAADERERQVLTTLLGSDGSTTELVAELTSRLSAEPDPVFEQDAWEALAAVCRDDLAIAKPGHDGWEGR
jgi:hypothetical protein